MKQLPTKALIKAPMNTERYVNATIMAFFAADLTYQLMFESCSQLQRDNKDLKPDLRRRFNNFIDQMDRARKAACDVGRDVMGLSEEQVENFFNDADYIKEVVMLVYAKTKEGKHDNAEKILQFLKQL